MSEESVAARAAMKAKASRMTTDPHEKVDASSWTPGDPMNASGQTGMKPISKRAYKRGGLVSQGEKARMRMDRMPRKSGGIATELMNRNQKEANEDREDDEGGKHIGALKRGGRAKKAGGGGFADPRALATAALGPASERAGVPTGVLTSTPTQSAFSKQVGIKTGGRVKKAAGGTISKDDPAGLRPVGGRIARKDGGRAKGKTNINIIIGAPKPDAGPPMLPPGLTPPPPGAGGPPPMPSPGGMPVGGGAPGGAPPIPPQIMGRKTGGRVANVHTGAGGGLGRLEKVEIQKRAD